MRVATMMEPSNCPRKKAELAVPKGVDAANFHFAADGDLSPMEEGRT
jgi:hypothetical protein